VTYLWVAEARCRVRNTAYGACRGPCSLSGRQKPARANMGLRKSKQSVHCFTMPAKMPKPEWRKRKEDYIAHLPEASPSVRLVSASDKLHNARAILRDYRVQGEALRPRFTRGRSGTLWYLS